MKIIAPTQIRHLLAPQLPAEVTPVWIAPELHFEGDPTGALAYMRWWGEQEAFIYVLQEAQQLRWVHTPSAGVDHLLVPAVYERDLLLTNSAGVHAIPMAEFVLGLLLAYVKRLPYFYNAQAERRWAGDIGLAELHGATMLILGLGGIGQAIAERAAAFGMRVWGSRRKPIATPHVERVVTGDEWRTLLPATDYLVVTAPLTAATRGMVDAAALAALPPSAYLVNVGRGPLIDEAALIEALRHGKLAGAALDTFDQEPLPPEHPFWIMPNVTITPHATAFSPRMHQRQVTLFLDNLVRFMQGQPLRNIVDKSAGY
ncbi:D-2-hydroxyacid dehydrogenase [Candidatus Viridilinea mediisalina]|uniref:Hydroxyacid dehydrogenase n=1 Tax=Candidatus Viridilinea mediisalina TaxID=2024553 RepID=A0A2A6RFB1_9CHLR|nr:D-2-hydroxyacid dehydrogenase [Candidatus Viridilinea mediisalina]PDW01633.1 hydroxyacid dehydrogenase [Candidatus Viridilinea mediisalina]